VASGVASVVMGGAAAALAELVVVVVVVVVVAVAVVGRVPAEAEAVDEATAAAGVLKVEAEVATAVWAEGTAAWEGEASMEAAVERVLGIAQGKVSLAIALERVSPAIASERAIRERGKVV